MDMRREVPFGSGLVFWCLDAGFEGRGGSESSSVWHAVLQKVQRVLKEMLTVSPTTTGSDARNGLSRRERVSLSGSRNKLKQGHCRFCLSASRSSALQSNLSVLPDLLV